MEKSVKIELTFFQAQYLHALIQQTYRDKFVLYKVYIQLQQIIDYKKTNQ